MIRSVIDDDGREWDATVEFASYGMQLLMFFPREGEGIRKAMMAASTSIEAAQELADLSDAQIRERLAQSVPWDSDNWFT